MARIREEGPTPSGGVYSMATYLDFDHNEVDQDDADVIIIGEYDNNDNLIGEVFCITEKGKEKQKK